MFHEFRMHPTAAISLMLFAIPALYADVTLHYKTTVTANPALPPQLTEPLLHSMGVGLPAESTVQFKNGKGYSLSGVNASLCDFAKQEITLLDKAGKRFATLPFQQFGDSVAGAMPSIPDQAKAMMAAMKTHFESKATGRTAIIQEVEGEERDLVMTIDAPDAPDLPPGPMVRMVMHFWTAKASEVMRVTAIRELAGYSLFAAATMNPAAAFEQAFRQTPGFADNFAALYKGIQSGGTPVILRMQVEMSMPVMTAALKNLPPGNNPFGAGFDPSAPLVQINQELDQLSSAAIPDSVFQVPDGYHAAAAVDILKDLAAKAKVPATEPQH